MKLGKALDVACPVNCYFKIWKPNSSNAWICKAEHPRQWLAVLQRSQELKQQDTLGQNLTGDLFWHLDWIGSAEKSWPNLGILLWLCRNSVLQRFIKRWRAWKEITSLKTMQQNLDLWLFKTFKLFLKIEFKSKHLWNEYFFLANLIGNFSTF